MRKGASLSFVLAAAAFCGAAPACAQSPAAAAPNVIHNSGHSNTISSVAISPDGRWLVSGSHDSSLKLWDVASGRLLRTLRGHSGKILSVGISPNGGLVTSVSDDNTAKLWEPATGRLIQTIAGLRSNSGFDPIQNASAISSDGKSVLTVSFNAIRRFDFSGKLQRSYAKRGLAREWTAFAASPDGRIIAAAHLTMQGNAVELFDAASGASIRTIGPANTVGATVSSIAFSPDGKFVSAAGNGGIAKTWDVASGRLLSTLNHSETTQSRYVEAVSFSPDSRVIATAGGAEGVKLWDVANGKLIRTLNRERNAWSRTVVFSPDGHTLISGAGSTLTATAAATGETLPTSFGAENLSSVSIAGLTDKTWLSIGEAGLNVWDAASWQLTQANHLKTGSVLGSDQFLATDGKIRGLLVSNDHAALKINVWDIRTGTLARTLDWGPTPLPGKPCPTCASYNLENVSISPDGRWIAATLWGDHTTVKVWDSETGRLVHRLPASGTPYRAAEKLIFSADSRSLIAANSDAKVNRSIRIWDLESGKILRTIPLPQQDNTGYADGSQFAVSPDGRLIAVKYNAWDARLQNYINTAALIAADSGRLVRSFAADKINNYAFVLKFSPDGQSVYVGAYNGEAVNVWDTATGRYVRSLDGNPGEAWSIAFSADGHQVIVGNNNGTSGIWDAATGNRLAITLHAGSGEWVTITPEGFFSASANGAELLHVVRGFEAIGINQVYQSLYRPDLVREKLAGDPRGLVREAAAKLDLNKVLESGDSPLVRVITPAPGATTPGLQTVAEVDIAPRGGGIGRVEWRVNGLTIGVETPPAPTAGQPLRLTRNVALDDGNNIVEVVAYNSANLIASEPARVSVTAQGATPTPSASARLFVLAAGVDNYADMRFKLALSVADVNALTQAFVNTGKAQYSSVEVKALLDTDVTAEKLDAAFAEIAGKMSPSDVFVLYLAGHGKTIDGRYYYVPQTFKVDGDVASVAVINAAVTDQGIAQDVWQRWFASVPARRSVILFDTCESGTLTADESLTKSLEQGAANDRLAQATGRSIITASSGTTEAFEGYRGHGLFTYNLLDALDRADGDNNGTIEVSELAAYVYAQVTAISERVFKQRQEPQVKVAANYPLTRQGRVLPDNEPLLAFNTPGSPTVQLRQEAQLQIKPTSGATVVRSLSASTRLTVLKSEGGWSLVASEGKPLGYIATRDLGPAN